MILSVSLRTGRSHLKLNAGSSAFKPFVGDDLDPETGQALIVMDRRGEVPDRRHTEITQDLRTDANLAPLTVAIRFRGMRLLNRLDRNARSTIAQVDEHTTAGLFEVLQHRLDTLRACDQVLHDIRLVQPRQDVLAVADAVIDEGGMGDRIERRA